MSNTEPTQLCLCCGEQLGLRQVYRHMAIYRQHLELQLAQAMLDPNGDDMDPAGDELGEGNGEVEGTHHADSNLFAADITFGMILRANAGGHGDGFGQCGRRCWCSARLVLAILMSRRC
jgi:hypothetical protein